MAWIQRMLIKRLQNQILKQHRQLYLLRCNRVASVTEANKSYHLNVRLCSSSPQSNSICSVHSLESRGLIQISGKDSLNLLQGLVTNDVSSLESKRKSLYAMLLNTQGRVLYDLLLYKMSDALDDDRILIECQKDIIPDLIKMMKMYKIRKKVDFDNVSDGYKIYAAFNLVKTETSSSSDKVYIYDDPRVNNFGCRIIAVGDLSGSSFLKNCSQDTEMSYHMKRYELGIGEGMLDFPFGNCTPLESNLALLNGVSFDKGCYIGQELTARTHHTGVIRKRLMPLQFQSPPELVGGARVLNDEGQAIGKFRNSVGLYGLALLRVLQVKKNVSVEGKDGKMYDAKVHRPVCWPPDLQT